MPQMAVPSCQYFGTSRHRSHLESHIPHFSLIDEHPTLAYHHQDFTTCHHVVDHILKPQPTTTSINPQQQDHSHTSLHPLTKEPNSSSHISSKKDQVQTYSTFPTRKNPAHMPLDRFDANPYLFSPSSAPPHQENSPSRRKASPPTPWNRPIDCETRTFKSLSFVDMWLTGTGAYRCFHDG